MIWGFTGTRQGMTTEQAMCFINLIDSNRADITEFHHGDCIGSDQQADAVVRRILGKDFSMDIHPPKEEKFRAFCAQDGDTVWEPKDYLVRDRDIAKAAQVLVATPKEFEEAQRSGTWATLRRAAEDSLILIIFPNGNLAKNYKFTRKPGGQPNV